MIKQNNCDNCIHKNVCKQTEKLQEEIERLSKKNNSEEQSFIIIVNCLNYDSIADILMRYKSMSDIIQDNIEDPEEVYEKLSALPYPLSVTANKFQYNCYFKNDIEWEKKDNSKERRE